MTQTQFRDALARLGLTQGQAAIRWDHDIKSVNNWATGKYPVPAIVAEVLRLWLKNGLPKD